MNSNSYYGGRGEAEPLLAKSWDQERPSKTYQDVWALFLFLGNFGVVTWLAFQYGVDALKARVIDASEDSYETGNNGHALLIGLSLVVVGGGLSLLWLWFMLSQAKLIIKFTLWMGVFVNLLVVALFAVAGSIVGCVIFSVVTAINIWWIYVVGPRIEFASSNLKVACSAVYDHVSVVLVAVVFLGVQMCWCCLWALAMVGLNERLSRDDPNTPPSTHDGGGVTAADDDAAGGFGDEDGSGGSPGLGLAFFALTVSFYWGLMVVKNIVHVTVCGTVGSWWFQQNPSSPIAGSLRRATTTSLGSICLGSLVVAVVKAMREAVNSMRREEGDNLMAACAECLLQCLDQLLTYFNRWAYTYVALYGTSFTSSGSSVMRLFRDRGWTTVINDSLIENVLSFGSMMVAGLTAAVGVLLADQLHKHTDYLQGVENAGLLLGLLGFMMGLAVALVLVSVVDSAVATVFVCFAEDPDALYLTHPEQHQALVQSWQMFHPDCLLRGVNVVV